MDRLNWGAGVEAAHCKETGHAQGTHELRKDLPAIDIQRTADERIWQGMYRCPDSTCERKTAFILA